MRYRHNEILIKLDGKLPLMYCHNVSLNIIRFLYGLVDRHLTDLGRTVFTQEKLKTADIAKRIQ